PGYLEARSRSENYALRAADSPQLAPSGCTTIPVVVHVLYQTAAQNIPDEQVKSQIAVLNDDFRMRNDDISTAPGAFQAVAGDPRLNFELATRDPGGSPTDGIIRVKVDKASFSTVADDVKFSAEEGSDAWPSERYLNIWVAPRLLSGSGQD